MQRICNENKDRREAFELLGRAVLDSSPRGPRERFRSKERKKTFIDRNRNIINKKLDIISKNQKSSGNIADFLNDERSVDEDFVVLKHDDYSDTREKLEACDTFDNDESIIFDDDKSGDTWGESEDAIRHSPHRRRFSNLSISVSMTSRESHVTTKSFKTIPQYNKNNFSERRKKYTYEDREKERDKHRSGMKRSEMYNLRHDTSHSLTYRKYTPNATDKSDKEIEHKRGNKIKKKYFHRRETKNTSSRIFHHRPQNLELNMITKKTDEFFNCKEIDRNKQWPLSDVQDHRKQEYEDEEYSMTVQYCLDIHEKNFENVPPHLQPKIYRDEKMSTIVQCGDNHDGILDENHGSSAGTRKCKIRRSRINIKKKVSDKSWEKIAKNAQENSAEEKSLKLEDDDSLMEAEAFYEVLKDVILSLDNAEIILKELHQALELSCFDTVNLNRVLCATEEWNSEDMDVLLYFRKFICQISHAQLILKRPAITLRYILKAKKLLTKGRSKQNKNSKNMNWIHGFVTELENIGSEALEAYNNRGNNNLKNK